MICPRCKKDTLRYYRDLGDSLVGELCMNKECKHLMVPCSIDRFNTSDGWDEKTLREKRIEFMKLPKEEKEAIWQAQHTQFLGVKE